MLLQGARQGAPVGPALGDTNVAHHRSRRFRYGFVGRLGLLGLRGRRSFPGGAEYLAALFHVLAQPTVSHDISRRSSVAMVILAAIGSLIVAVVGFLGFNRGDKLRDTFAFSDYTTVPPLNLS